MSDLNIDELLAGMQASGLRTIVITDEETPMKELTMEQLQRVADLLVKAYGHEIARDGDWWFGIDDYDFNIHDSDDEQNTGYFNVNVYKHDGKGMSNYDEWFDLPKVFIEGAQTEPAHIARTAYRIFEREGEKA